MTTSQLKTRKNIYTLVNVLKHLSDDSHNVQHRMACDASSHTNSVSSHTNSSTTELHIRRLPPSIIYILSTELFLSQRRTETIEKTLVVPRHASICLSSLFSAQICVSQFRQRSWPSIQYGRGRCNKRRSVDRQLDPVSETKNKKINSFSGEPLILAHPGIPQTSAADHNPDSHHVHREQFREQHVFHAGWRPTDDHYRGKKWQFIFKRCTQI